MKLFNAGSARGISRLLFTFILPSMYNDPVGFYNCTFPFFFFAEG
uniref:Uncharacterized protein n=1 Tax=Anguilla anguilla TaxID=7936 RepID=A0A0E9X7L0_ANGAN